MSESKGMPEGEEMFNYHGYSGPCCPKPPLPPATPSADRCKSITRCVLQEGHAGRHSPREDVAQFTMAELKQAELAAALQMREECAAHRPEFGWISPSMLGIMGCSCGAKWWHVVSDVDATNNYVEHIRNAPLSTGSDALLKQREAAARGEAVRKCRMIMSEQLAHLHREQNYEKICDVSLKADIRMTQWSELEAAASTPSAAPTEG